MDNVVRRRLLSRALMIGSAVMLVAGLATIGYLWHRDSTRPSQVSAAAPEPSASPIPTQSPSVPEPPPIPAPASSLVADVAVPSVPVYGAPAVGKVLAQVPDRNAMGQTEALLVTDASVPGWYEVQVPVRPNGSQGWVQASDVKIRQVTDYIRVYLGRFRLEHYVAGRLDRAFTVAVGAPSTPTPTGHFYVWASEPHGAPYTPGIFALSAFSPVLENWPGGGRTGIHGWTDTSVLGKRASHGCVRMAPADFAQLLHSVPLGTPVDLFP